MICFVHHQHFSNKFHAAVNQLRHLKEFSHQTIQNLPKRCCSCFGKQNDVLSSITKCYSTRTTIFDTLRLICLQYELEQYVSLEKSLTPFKTKHFLRLPFPTLLDSQEETKLSNGFIARQDNIQDLIQHIQNARFEFITPTTSKTLLCDLTQVRYLLVTRCSTYAEAIQAIYGLWVMISVEDPSHFEIIKHILEQQWMKFLENSQWVSSHRTFNWRQDLPRKIMFKKTENVRQYDFKYDADEDDAKENSIDDEISMATHPSLTFRPIRFKTSNSSRNRRRQHLLFLATNI
ncbi:unnamed protein product [Adineta ricciae]|uniref:Uncharacterized protein n=1 Tax=Adineta ricciae TaxID=249248 RepID=A0A814SM54_ADIRI|nr:unnamed protein product [Adineta ricciae]CAF1633518.1 unnamed protein product [Adineta ricciae]